MAKYKMLKALTFYEDKSRVRHDYSKDQVLNDPPAELIKICIDDAVKIKEKPTMEKISGIGKFTKTESKPGVTSKKKK